MQAYLDNNATTPVAPEVLAAMLPFFSGTFGNASSQHSAGREAARAVEDARTRILSALAAPEFDVVFTSSGTEADNLAIWGSAMSSPRGRHVLTTAIEHPAILRQCTALEPFGFKTTLLKPDAQLRIEPAAFEGSATAETAVVSVMHVNNELGLIQSVSEIAAAVKRRNPSALVHVDAVQSIGKLALSLDGIDLLSLSGHKIHGPKGVGALLVRRGIELRSQLVGGPHERGRRAGTLNVPSIVGLGHAVESACRTRDETWAAVTTVREKFVSALRQLPGVVINSPSHASPSTVSVAFPGITGADMVEQLSNRGVAASAGAACAAGEVSRSHVLTAAGLPSDIIDRTVRFSFSRTTAETEIGYALTAIEAVLKKVEVAHGV